MHVFAAAPVLAGTHQLVVDSSRTTPSCLAASMACLSFLRDHGHPVEAVLGQVEILSGFELHFLALIIIKRQLLYFETVLVVDLVGHTAHASWVNQLALCLISWLAVIVVRERYLRMTLVRRNLVAVHGVHILRMLI